MQEAYDAMNSTFESALETMQNDLPEFECYIYNACEADGDVLAVIKAGK